MSDGLVGDGELGEVVTSHLRLDLDGVWRGNESVSSRVSISPRRSAETMRLND